MSDPPGAEELERAIDAARKPASEQPALRISGRAASVSRSLPRAILRWLTGVALVSWLVRVVRFVLSSRRELEIELRGKALRVRGRTTLLGRTLRQEESVHDVCVVSSALRYARYAPWRAAVSLLSLSCGLLVGGHFLFDGSRGGAPLLLLLGVMIIALGSGLDLAFELLSPGIRARTQVELVLRGLPRLAVADVPIEAADRFLAALEKAIATRGA